MQLNQEIELKITDMTEDGKGIGKADGLAVFVEAKTSKGDTTSARPESYKGASSNSAEPSGTSYKSVIPGDVVRAVVRKAKKNYALADATEMIEASPDRIPASCPYFGECGGCTLQELSYEAQLRFKREQVVSKLERIAGLKDPTVRDTVGADRLQYYRNKATFAVGPHGEVGFLKGKSHFVIDVEDCMLQSDAAMVCAEALRNFLGGKNRGIRQMIVKTAFSTGEVMVVIESEKKDIRGIEKLIEMLDDAVYSINAKEDGDRSAAQGTSYSLESVAVIYGADEAKGRMGKCINVAGKPTICEEVVRSDGKVFKFEIGPQSFYQTNHEQMVKLYDRALEYATAPSENAPREAQGKVIGTLLDLYCGIGTIGIWMSDKAEQVIGIESVKPAVIDANRNSVINRLINTRYIAGKAEEELPGMMGLAKLYKWNEVNERVEREPEIKIESADAVILDPPRAGCDEALLSAVCEVKPSRIVYVSCDAGTLSRDVKFLIEHGYEFAECTPVDMFPWTTHVETVVALSHQNAQ